VKTTGRTSNLGDLVALNLPRPSGPFVHRRPLGSPSSPLVSACKKAIWVACWVDVIDAFGLDSSVAAGIGEREGLPWQVAVPSSGGKPEAELVGIILWEDAGKLSSTRISIGLEMRSGNRYLATRRSIE
jgi:hypothetical protein